MIKLLSKLLSNAKVREGLLGGGLLCCIAALILFPGQSVAAARDGLTLCYNVIIPSLFPFFVLSSLVVELGLVSYLGNLLAPLMVPLFRVPGEGATALALGFVGGYPVGARTTLSLYEKGLCTKTEAERMLAFCNNSGPAFILGVVGAGVFSSGTVGLLLYLAHAAASVCVGILFRFYRAAERPRPSRSPQPRFAAPRLTTAFTGSVKESFAATLNICAFVVFFTVVIRLLLLTGAIPALGRAITALLTPFGFQAQWSEKLLIGLVELSSGVSSLSAGADGSGGLKLAAFMLGWAGLSVHCQVLSFVGGSGLSVRPYFFGKLLHGGLSALFIGGLARLFPTALPVAVTLVEQVEDLTHLDFSTALTLSTTAAFLVWLAFFFLALFAIGKNSGKRRKKMIQYK